MRRAVCGTSWREVRDRSPLRATTALYRFGIDEPLECDVDDDERRDGKPFGQFDWSPACFELVETLDEWWQGYDGFTKPQKKKARKWVEEVLAAQPGFLEAGLALATMQNDAREAEASVTLDRFIRQAEVLIPAGFKGRIDWAHIENRFYHRMLWLRMQMHYDAGDLKSAVKFARKQLKLNPGDNLGVRFVHPLLLLRLREFAAAKRATKALAGEAMTAALIRAFCEFALGNGTAFRRELAEALISLPVIRLLLLNQAGPLPEGDDGYRGIRPDLTCSWRLLGASTTRCRGCGMPAVRSWPSRACCTRRPNCGGTGRGFRAAVPRGPARWTGGRRCASRRGMNLPSPGHKLTRLPSGARSSPLPRIDEPTGEAEARAGLPVLAFASASLFEQWMVQQPAASKGLWLKLAKRGAGQPSVGKQEAIEVVMCHGGSTASSTLTTTRTG